MEDRINKQDFFKKVYKVVKQIPKGRVTTYGAIARHLGEPLAARLVGLALNQSFENDEFIPAHRVVNRIGLLTGKKHFGNTQAMQQLIENEGVCVTNDRVDNFDKLLWLPYKELKKPKKIKKTKQSLSKNYA